MRPGGEALKAGHWGGMISAVRSAHDIGPWKLNVRYRPSLHHKRTYCFRPKADEQQCASYRPFTTADTILENGKFACKVRSKTRIRTRRNTGFEVLNIVNPRMAYS